MISTASASTPPSTSAAPAHVLTVDVLATISIGAGKGPGEVAVDPRTHSLFVVDGDETVPVIDTQTRQVVETLPMPRHSIVVAVDSEAGAAFLSSGGTVTAIDTRTLRIVDIVEWDGAAQLAVDSRGVDGIVTVIAAGSPDPRTPTRY